MTYIYEFIHTFLSIIKFYCFRKFYDFNFLFSRWIIYIPFSWVKDFVRHTFVVRISFNSKALFLPPLIFFLHLHEVRRLLWGWITFLQSEMFCTSPISLSRLRRGESMDGYSTPLHLSWIIREIGALHI